MAWDNSRPVPWKRLMREWVIYAGIMSVVFLFVFNNGNPAGAIAGVLVSGPMYLGLGWVLAKIGYQRKTMKEMRTAQASTSDAGSTARRARSARRAATIPTSRAPASSHRVAARPVVATVLNQRTTAAADSSPTLGAPTTLIVVTSQCVIAIDAGTTGVRSRAVFTDDSPTVASYREFTQHYPQPGWVEHDANEIWAAVVETLNEVIDEVGRDRVAAIGITNQRETVLAWDRTTGATFGTAIVWQDRRTANRCDELTAEGRLDMVRERTGLVLDPYFSGTKFEWLLQNRDIPVDDKLALGTIDSWLIWNLTAGAVFATDVTNASRTMLCDIRTRTWDADLCDMLHVPMSALAKIVPSSGRVGITSDGVRRSRRHPGQRRGGRPAGSTVRSGVR